MSGNLLLGQLESLNFLKDVFFEANWLFLFYAIVVVFFIAGWKVFGTTIATVFYTLTGCLILFYAYMSGNKLYKTLDALLDTFCGKSGIMLLLISFVYLVLGLKDEETTKEYVHTVFYWVITVIVSYVSIFSICFGLYEI